MGCFAGVVCTVQSGLWQPHLYDIAMMAKFTTYWLVQAERFMAAYRSNRCIIVFDVAGWALWMAGYLSHLRGSPLVVICTVPYLHASILTITNHAT